ncbi:MAG: PRC-barrel domain-containing protein [Thermoplasmata archaeon]
MVCLSEIKKMEVLSSDGRAIGHVDDITIDDKWSIKGFTLKLDKEVARSMGKQTPLLSALKLDVGLDIIKSIGDKVLLNQPVSELGAHMKTQEGVRRVSSFMGMKVVSTEGKILGKVDDIAFEPYTWKMPSLHITVPRDVLDALKAKKPILGKGTLSLSMVHVKSIKDYVMLDTDYEGLSRILETSTVKAH